MRIATQKAYVVMWKDMKRWMIPTDSAIPTNLTPSWKIVCVRELVRQVTESVVVASDVEYKMLGVKWYGEGTFHRETVRGENLSAKYVTPVIPNAFIYNRLFAWKQSFAVVPTEHGDCFVSNEFPQFIVDENQLSPHFLYLFFMMRSTAGAVSALSVGSSAVSRNRFKEEDLLDFEITLPPLPVQRAIVARWRRAKDEIRESCRRIISLENQILIDIQEAVGMRVNREATMPRAFALKWSQLDRWGVVMCWQKVTRPPASTYPTEKLGSICRIGSGGTPSRNNHLYFGGDIPWVKTTEVRNELIYSTEEHLTREGVENSSAKVYPAGSLLVAMYGQGATRGRTAKLGIEAATNQACAVLTDFDGRIETDYLWFFLWSQYESLRELASGNNQPNLNAEMISNYPVPIPPLEVQREIVSRAEAARAEIARERETAARRAREAEAEVEALILGTKKLEAAH